MARYTGADCKQCRREEQKLFLKGTKCFSNKCPFEKKGYAPGQHGRTRRFKQSDYGLQLREKQKVRKIYGIFEAQFRNYFKKADRMRGITGDNLIKLLELRLDNLVYRMGFAPSRKAARQLVRHRHFCVNGKIVDIPAFNVRVGDEIQVRDKSKKMDAIHASIRRIKEGRLLPWLKLEKATLIGTLLEEPIRAEIPLNVNEQLIVELYSK
ncbi:30S ribosomal protein S4 [candidate division KSB1 bacterium]|nr:30S ribosomal protein S4 [candidate division KSB1 bacterium]